MWACISTLKVFLIWRIFSAVQESSNTRTIQSQAILLRLQKSRSFLVLWKKSAGQYVNWRALYEKALNHDYAELFTGDIKTPVKYASKELKRLFNEVEEEMTKKFVEQEFPLEFQAIYLERFKEGKDDTLEGRILSVADKVDLLYEAFGEIQKENPEPLFLEIYEEALSTILLFKDMTCVKYFLEHILPDMLRERFIEQSELTGHYGKDD